MPLATRRSPTRNTQRGLFVRSGWVPPVGVAISLQVSGARAPVVTVNLGRQAGLLAGFVGGVPGSRQSRGASLRPGYTETICRPEQQVGNELHSGRGSGHAPVALYDAAIFEDRIVTQAAVAAAGLDWLVAAGVRLVNMSFGLRNDRSGLRQACGRALARDAILIAAAPARGAPVFSGVDPSVIRATGDARCALGEISALGGSQADFAGHARRIDEPRDEQKLGGASFGTAYVTATVAEFPAENAGAGRMQVLRHLAAVAQYHGP